MKVLKRKRIMSFIMDMYLATMLQFIPLAMATEDNSFNTVKYSWPVIFLVYYVLIPVFFKATPGRFLCSYHIGSDEKNVKFAIFKRQLILMILWPINAFVTLHRENETHLADQFAKTYIKRNEKDFSSWISLSTTVMIVILSSLISSGLLISKVTSHDSYIAASEYIIKEHPNFNASFFPTGSKVTNDTAQYIIEGDDKQIQIYLEKIDGKWKVINSNTY